MISPSVVSAVLVTRGDCDLSEITDSIRFAGIEDIVVWDNAVRGDLGIYGRYAAIAEAKHDVIVTQDDDVLVNCWADILAAYEPGRLTVNYPEPWDIPWVARGAIFDRALPGVAHGRYLGAYEMDRLFTHSICDAVFSLLTPTTVLDFGSVDLPHGFLGGRVSTSEGWYDVRRPEAQRRCGSLRCSATEAGSRCVEASGHEGAHMWEDVACFLSRR